MGAGGLELLAPAPSDWIVSLRKTDGSVIRYRVGPGTVSDSIALERAIRAARLRPDQIEDATLCRASERIAASVATGPDMDAEFRRLLQRARGDA